MELVGVRGGVIIGVNSIFFSGFTGVSLESIFFTCSVDSAIEGDIDVMGVSIFDAEFIGLEYAGVRGGDIIRVDSNFIIAFTGVSFESIWDIFSVDAAVDFTGLAILDTDFIGLE